MSIEALRQEVQKIKWWHSIDLGNGVVTPGIEDSAAKLKKLGLPKDLTGMSVLDIGALDGMFSFEAERRGASRVVALDSFCWSGKSLWSKAGFDLAKKALNSKVEEVQMDVLDICPEKLGSFDLVLFLGVLYHMRHPLLALERVFSVTQRQLILETHVDMRGCRRPVMVFYPDAELNNDPTNWWGPNPAAVKAMLRSAGFRKVEVISKPSFIRRIAGAIKCRIVTATKGRLAVSESGDRRAPILSSIRQGRMAFHAWR